MQKLSTAAAVAAAEKVTVKTENFCKLTFFLPIILKNKNFLLESKFLIPKS
jgi:hypothetical protein